MLLLRKIDCYGQLIVAALIVLSVPVLFLFGFLIGLFCIGCWQLLSAALNTYSFIHAGYKKQIILYWKFCIVDLGLFFLFLLADKNSNPDYIYMIFWIATPGAVMIAGYYWKIYFKLIEFIALRNEMQGLIKSKH